MAKSKSTAVRSGRLAAPHSSVTILAEPYTWDTGPGAFVIYTGTLEALLAAGCLTEKMVQGKKRGMLCLDETGSRYSLHRSPTKAVPDRRRVGRRVYSELLAMELPGVRELFPEGIPKLEATEPHAAEPGETQAANVVDWEENEREGLSRFMWAGLAAVEGTIARASGVESTHADLRETSRPDPMARFRWSRGGVNRVRRFLQETQERFETILDSMRAEDRKRLRLVVDNTQAARP